MFLITSGAYIDKEFASEIGMLPPAFLPLGNQFLFEHQVSIAKKIDDNVAISVPKSYSVSEMQAQRLKKLDVRLIKVDENITLGESIRLCLNKDENDSLYILHGDTLFKDLDAAFDCTYISKNIGFYERAFVDNNQIVSGLVGDEKDVLSGYFSFRSLSEFCRCLEVENYDFLAALNQYKEKNGIDLKLMPGWYDFGHINAYFNSRASFTTERSFNQLKLYGDLVTKSSCQNKKIMGEASWYENLPGNLQLYTPKLIKTEKKKSNSSHASYTLEYLYNLPLSDLCVYGELNQETWKSIFNSCKKFCDLAKSDNHRLYDVTYEAKEISYKLDDIYNKTKDRIKLFEQSSGFDISSEFFVNEKRCPSLLEVAAETYSLIRGQDVDEMVVVHGDFCFSNILYDFRTRRIKVIDPRGIDFNNKITNLGDQRYDLAKLYHSIYGLYDFIIAGHMNVNRVGNLISCEIFESKNLKDMQSAFDQIFFSDNFEMKRFVHILTIHLFISMLPLHDDRADRQDAMIATVAKLYFDLKRNQSCS